MSFPLTGNLVQFNYTKDSSLNTHWEYTASLDFASFNVPVPPWNYPTKNSPLRPSNIQVGVPSVIVDPSPTLAYFETQGFVDAYIDLSSVQVAQDTPPKMMSVTLLEPPIEFNYSGSLVNGPATFGPLLIVFPNGQFQVFQIPIQQIIPNTGTALTNFWTSGGSQIWNLPVTINNGGRILLRKFAHINSVSNATGLTGLVSVTLSNSNLNT